MGDKISGVLEVGCNEHGDIIVNHPDLKPDANGVGHIVFSPSQARHLAQSLTKHADQVERENRIKADIERMKAAAAIPVDRSARVLTDGSPVTDDHRELLPSGQQKGYVVLSAEERAKGFVRPYRDAYRHVGRRGPFHTLRDLTDEERELYGCRFAKFEYCGPSSLAENAAGRYWTKAELDAVGCGTVTTMGRALSETYARDPSFYGSTFCVACHAHYPVAEFVWTADGQQVGS